MKNGFYVVGKCLGSRQLKNVDDTTGEIKFKNEIGIGIARPDGFGGTTQTEIKISVRDKDLFTNELVEKVQKLMGKTVIVQVYPSAWGFNGKTGISYIFNSESTIEELKI
ncbi:DNA-binding protein [Pasteurella skyensis]|uniref:DNA-binding protein n=1 Tax=Phocoenobacter skyensis TaxID=97481 RepID=A0AAJ6NBV9_9PAST|nr:DNA-binding protein [Pasteurella skyensis]MDP8163496.1 DNA-binding protein [Pasteurella skyensis]MDP8173811.1 DNA-binding protein [Pasteurella skyensis]MDP8179960.1 DNA-binding protein [Pasteurella skyensis]MDP8182657.1 DNA-binding protein [Pasteurella skyensis]MDP8182670.1 DNA-binding protein [Pasteurella skyensis]